MPTTAKGFPYPDGPDANDLPGDLQALAEALDAAPGVASLTQAQIDALSAPQKWAGRIVWNSTVSKHQKSDGSTFSDLDSLVGLSSSTPQALGAASAGTSVDASRADHRHAMPSPADIGAASAGHTHPYVPSASVGANNGVASLDSAGQVPASQLGNATGGATGGGTDKVFYVNDQSVTANYSIPSGKNAVTAGPISIGTGVTVTVPTGSVWAIV